MLELVSTYFSTLTGESEKLLALMRLTRITYDQLGAETGYAPSYLKAYLRQQPDDSVLLVTCREAVKALLDAP